MSAPPTPATPSANAVSEDSALVRQSILKLKPYVPGKPIEEVKRELGLPADFAIIKLASNENVLGPSPHAVEAMKNAAAGVWLYPDDTCHDLKLALSDFWNLSADHFILGNGSDEIIHFLGQAFLDSARGDEVIFGDPSFVQYKSCALMADCAFHAVPLTPDYRHDLAAMKARVNPKTRLIFIANSNNPTGTVVTRAEFDALLDGLPPHVVVVWTKPISNISTMKIVRAPSITSKTTTSSACTPFPRLTLWRVCALVTVSGAPNWCAFWPRCAARSTSICWRSRRRRRVGRCRAHRTFRASQRAGPRAIVRGVR